MNPELLSSLNSVDLLLYCVGILFAVTAQGAAEGITAAVFRASTDEDDEDQDERPQLNLNFFAHIDLLALPVFFLGGFGWARKPPYTETDFVHPRIAFATIALVGIITNLLVAVSLSTLADFLWTSKAFNVVMLINLAVFSYGLLVPIPPLAASRLIYLFLAKRQPRLWSWYAKSGPILLIGLAALERFTSYDVLQPLVRPLLDALISFCI